MKFSFARIFFLLSLCLTLPSCKDDKQPTKQIKPIVKTPETPLEKSVARGREIYSELCVTCHLPNGKGVPGAFPPLNPSDWLTHRRKESIHVVKYGLKGEIVVNGQTYNGIMLPLGLEDDEVADVMNYTIQTWNSGDMVTVEEVSQVTK